jgi:GntR family transcriptional regulator of arabinose operon
MFEERIANSTWRLGQILPTEAQLADQFFCSRGTISKALGRLQQQGLVERRTRVGTRVIATKAPAAGRSPSLQLDACAIVFPNEKHELIWQVVQGFQQAAREASRRTVLLTTGTDFRKEAEIIGRLGEFDVKGAVLYPVISSPRDQLYFSQMILSCSYPVVLADVSLPNVARPSAVCDHFHAGFSLTRHFLAQGCRRIGFLGSNSWSTPARECHLGYRFAMEQAQVPVEPKAVLMHPTMHVNLAAPTAESFSLAQQLLTQAPDLEAIVCFHDFLARGCLEAAGTLGFDVPSRLKIGSMGSRETASRSRPSLTTYVIDYPRVGREAFRLLQRCIAGEEPGAEEIKVRGVIDGDTAPAATGFAA